MTVKNGGYGGAPWLAFAINSIRQQSCSDWEFIIVDDGSTDNTVELIRRLSGGDARIRVIQTDGVGRGKALNIALSECRGEYVANVDADDVAHPKRLETEAAVLSKDNRFDVVCSQCLVVLEDEAVSWSSVPQNHEINVEDVTCLLCVKNPVSHSSVMMKRRAVISVGGYDESRQSHFDWDLWVRLAAAGYRIGRIDQVLAAKRLHGKQSFEVGRRLRYVLEGQRVRMRAGEILGCERQALMQFLIRLPWDLAPNYVRVLVRRVLRKRNGHASNQQNQQGRRL